MNLQEFSGAIIEKMIEIGVWENDSITDNQIQGLVGIFEVALKQSEESGIELSRPNEIFDISNLSEENLKLLKIYLDMLHGKDPKDKAQVFICTRSSGEEAAND